MEKVRNASTNTNSEEKSRSVILSSKLFDLITSVKEIKLVTNVKEVLDGLKEYISVKQLYDPQDPRKIHCKNDELGSVLGVDEFSIPEVANFLPKLVSPVNSEVISSSVGNNSKRKNEENSSSLGGNSSTSKKSKIDEIIIYIPPSPIRDNISDSAESFQGYETAIVKDTSDENFSSTEIDSDNFTHSIVAVEETYNIEYEVDSLSSLSSDTFSTCSDNDSEMDALNSAIITVICKSDSDMEFWADKSSDDDFYSFDAEISDSDKWACATCSTLNDPPNRFCERCFETRKGWLPSKRQIPKRKSRSKRKRVSTITKEKESTKTNRINICEFPSTSSSSQENNSPLCTEKEMKHSNNFNFDSESNISNSKLCFLCYERPANGTIIHAHTKYAHTIACYPCARKLKDQKKRCPICRRSIDRVVYQILG